MSTFDDSSDAPTTCPRPPDCGRPIAGVAVAPLTVKLLLPAFNSDPGLLIAASASCPATTCCPFEYVAMIWPPLAMLSCESCAACEPSCFEEDKLEVCANCVNVPFPLESNRFQLIVMLAAPSASPVTFNATGEVLLDASVPSVLKVSVPGEASTETFPVLPPVRSLPGIVTS